MTGEPQRYIREGPVFYPKLGKFIALIGQIIEDDKTAPVKQRQRERETFVPLTYELGGTDGV